MVEAARSTSLQISEFSPRVPVSAYSLMGDDIWRLDIATAGRRPDQCIINWGYSLDDGSLLTDECHRDILVSSKEFIWSLHARTIHGRKRCSHSTMFSKSKIILIIVKYLISKKIKRFSYVLPGDIDDLIAYLRSRPPARRKRHKRESIDERTLSTYLTVLKDLYRYRAVLRDCLKFDPFPIETTFEVAGVVGKSGDSIPYIPDKIAVHLIGEAVKWVSEYSNRIFAARNIAGDVYIRGYSTSKERIEFQRAISGLNIDLIPGSRRCGLRDIARLERHLTIACFIVVAGLVGMRVSEILSLQIGCVERRYLGRTSQYQSYLRAILFKTSDNVAGTLTRWIAPEPVVEAVRVLERLSALQRAEANSRNLFLVRYRTGAPSDNLTQYRASVWLDEFVALSSPPLHGGKVWRVSAHQFRKTFARFVAKQDRAQLLGLAEHYKHASVAMTAKGYIGTDFDLEELIDVERRAETAIALESMLSSGNLAGKLGRRIARGNYSYRGRAGDQVRRDYVNFVLRETDLQVHACEYGWCVFQPETSRCGGEVAPNTVLRNPGLCSGCSNFVVEERHRQFWEARRKRNASLLDHATPITKAVVIKAIDECDLILDALNSKESGDEA